MPTTNRERAARLGRLTREVVDHRVVLHELRLWDGRLVTKCGMASDLRRDVPVADGPMAVCRMADVQRRACQSCNVVALWSLSTGQARGGSSSPFIFGCWT